MSYSISIPIDYGIAGSTLLGSLTNANGSPHATVRDLSVVEIGQGFYQLVTSAIPDGYSGTLVIHSTALASASVWTGVTIRAVTSINPQETENADAKTSAVQAEVEKVPREGATYLHRNADTDETATVTIEEP